jgi:hypothetical protein
MQQEPSTVEDLESLYPNYMDGGLTWLIFGNCSEDIIRDIEKQWFPTNVVKRALVHDIWVRHPRRQQQGKVM